MQRMTVDINILDSLDELAFAMTYLHALQMAFDGFEFEYSADASALDRLATDCKRHLKRLQDLLQAGQKTARKAA